MATRADFQPKEVIRLLGRHRVQFVLIGGLAAVAHGSPLVTQDIDICYARDPQNVERLATALAEVRATPRGADPGLPFQPDQTTLRAGDSFTFDTTLGPLDVIGTPGGSDGYGDLVRTAVAYELFGNRVLVASIDDLIRMKRAAARPKDLRAVEELGALREELDRGK